MKKLCSIATIIFVAGATYAQTPTAVNDANNIKTTTDTSINKIDKNGLKQGFWREIVGNVKTDGF